MKVTCGHANQYISSVTLCIATAVISFALRQPAVNKIIVPRSTSKLSFEYNVVPSFDQLKLMKLANLASDIRHIVNNECIGIISMYKQLLLC